MKISKTVNKANIPEADNKKDIPDVDTQIAVEAVFAQGLAEIFGHDRGRC